VEHVRRSNGIFGYSWKYTYCWMRCLYLFIYYIFNDPVSRVCYIASNGTMISKYWIENIWKERSWPNWRKIPAFFWRDCRRPRKLSHDGRSPGSNSNRASLDYKSDALSLNPNWLVLSNKLQSNISVNKKYLSRCVLCEFTLRFGLDVHYCSKKPAQSNRA
jgi:hypothetical protein